MTLQYVALRGTKKIKIGFLHILGFVFLIAAHLKTHTHRVMLHLNKAAAQNQQHFIIEC